MSSIDVRRAKMGQSGKASQRKLPKELLKLEIREGGAASRLCHFQVVWL